MAKTPNPIPPRERAVIRAIAEALGGPRDRLGRIDSGHESSRAMDSFWPSYQLPHGGIDTADKARLILLALIGDKITDLPTPSQRSPWEPRQPSTVPGKMQPLRRR